MRHVTDEQLGKIARQQAGNTYPLTVDYERSVKQAVERGRYDYGCAPDDITSERFPTKRKGTADVEVELIHFNRVILSNDEALRELEKMGMRPAELHELLALGEKYPDVQRDFPVVALGSIWQDRNGDRFVPCLSGCGSERGLDLIWIEVFEDEWEDDWDQFCCFAAVRKSLGPWSFLDF